MINWKTS